MGVGAGGVLAPPPMVASSGLMAAHHRGGAPGPQPAAGATQASPGRWPANFRGGGGHDILGAMPPRAPALLDLAALRRAAFDHLARRSDSASGLARALAHKIARAVRA